MLKCGRRLIQKFCSPSRTLPQERPFTIFSPDTSQKVPSQTPALKRGGSNQRNSLSRSSPRFHFHHPPKPVLDHNHSSPSRSNFILTKTEPSLVSPEFSFCRDFCVSWRFLSLSHGHLFTSINWTFVLPPKLYSRILSLHTYLTANPTDN